MTYASGGLIQATDYNGFVASVNAIWGTGTGDAGYGQATTLSTVAASNTVTAAQWSTLITRLNSISLHQTGSNTALALPSAGNVIAYLSTLSSTISTLTTNRLNFNTQGASTTTTVTNTATWTTSSIKEVSLTFANAAAMRYFFNNGGEVTFTGKNSNLGGNNKSTDWDNLLAACGDVRIRAQVSAKVGGSGTPSVNNTNLGFYDLTTAYQKIIEQFSTTATGGYNLNYATFEAKLNATPGSSTVLSVRMTLTDAAADTPEPLTGGTTDTVGAVSPTNVVQFDVTRTPPESTNISNVWGAITAATVTNTQA